MFPVAGDLHPADPAQPVNAQPQVSHTAAREREPVSSGTSPARGSGRHRHSLPPMGPIMPQENAVRSVNNSPRRSSWSPSAIEHANAAADHVRGPSFTGSRPSSTTTEEFAEQFVTDRDVAASQHPGESLQRGEVSPGFGAAFSHSAPELLDAELRRSSVRQSSLISAPAALGSALVDEVVQRSHQERQPQVSHTAAGEREPVSSGTSPARSSGRHRHSLPPMGPIMPQENAVRSVNNSPRRSSWSPSAIEHANAAADHVRGPSFTGSRPSSTTTEEFAEQFVTDREVAASQHPGESLQRGEVSPGFGAAFSHSAPELLDAELRRSSVRQSSLISAPAALGSALVDEVVQRSHQERQPQVSHTAAGEREPVSSGTSPARSSGRHRHSLPPMGPIMPQENAVRSVNNSPRRSSWSPSAIEHANAAADHVRGPSFTGSRPSSTTTEEFAEQFVTDRDVAASQHPGESLQRGEVSPGFGAAFSHSAPELLDAELGHSSVRLGASALSLSGDVPVHPELSPSARAEPDEFYDPGASLGLAPGRSRSGSPALFAGELAGENEPLLAGSLGRITPEDHTFGPHQRDDFIATSHVKLEHHRPGPQREIPGSCFGLERGRPEILRMRKFQQVAASVHQVVAKPQAAGWAAECRPGSEAPCALEAPCDTLFEELDAVVQEAFALLDPERLCRELASTQREATWRQ
eukprot:Skav234408  [mRNA]  locus=scaffold873:400094:404038:- [translate_table: standard]